MFAIAVRFPSGRYYAASHADRGRPEWPPHPDRLFSALVAACYQACGGEGRAALTWLEQQGPPALAVPPPPVVAGAGRAVYAMVSTNDATPGGEGMGVLPGYRIHQPRHFPSIAVDGPVYFVWPDADPDAEIGASLAHITARMTYLGSSKSPVIAWIEPDPPAPTLRPVVRSAPAGESVVLRVPTAGRLAELDAQYAAGLRPRPGHPQLYAWGAPEVPDGAPAPHLSAFGELFVLARTSGPTPSVEATLTVTHALRRALLAVGAGGPEGGPVAHAAGTDGPEPVVPELLHGHGPAASPHCAFVALPHVGAPYADGHVLGLAVVFPRACDTAQRRTVLARLGVLEYVQTPVGQIGLARPARQDPDAIPWGLRPARWCGPARGATTWTSVTPVLFDAFPRPSRGGVLGAVRALARHAGLPAPLEAAAQQVSPLTGVPPASAFRARRTEHDVPRYVAHLTVTFERAVAGPVLLGAGRFFGLGLCAPLATERD